MTQDSRDSNNKLKGQKIDIRQIIHVGFYSYWLFGVKSLPVAPSAIQKEAKRVEKRRKLNLPPLCRRTTTEAGYINQLVAELLRPNNNGEKGSQGGAAYKLNYRVAKRVQELADRKVISKFISLDFEELTRTLDLLATRMQQNVPTTGKNLLCSLFKHFFSISSLVLGISSAKLCPIIGQGGDP